MLQFGRFAPQTASWLVQASDDELRHRLTELPGIGEWTLEMFLIFQLHRHGGSLLLAALGLGRLVQCREMMLGYSCQEIDEAALLRGAAFLGAVARGRVRWVMSGFGWGWQMLCFANLLTRGQESRMGTLQSRVR